MIRLRERHLRWVYATILGSNLIIGWGFPPDMLILLAVYITFVIPFTFSTEAEKWY